MKQSESVLGATERVDVSAEDGRDAQRQALGYGTRLIRDSLLGDRIAKGWGQTIHKWLTPYITAVHS